MEFIPAEEALPLADVVVCAMDLNDESRNYFDATRLRLFKRGALFVNVSRGELSPSRFLLPALKWANWAAWVWTFTTANRTWPSRCAARPLTDPEVVATLELAKRQDAICTPHNAFNSVEAVERKSRHSVQQIEHFLAHRRFLWSAPVA